jgi:hypothetical protein
VMTRRGLVYSLSLRIGSGSGKQGTEISFFIKAGNFSTSSLNVSFLRRTLLRVVTVASL